MPTTGSCGGSTWPRTWAAMAPLTTRSSGWCRGSEGSYRTGPEPRGRRGKGARRVVRSACRVRGFAQPKTHGGDHTTGKAHRRQNAGVSSIDDMNSGQSVGLRTSRQDSSQPRVGARAASAASKRANAPRSSPRRRARGACRSLPAPLPAMLRSARLQPSSRSVRLDFLSPTPTPSTASVACVPCAPAKFSRRWS
jgi:hypothetical protein